MTPPTHATVKWNWIVHLKWKVFTCTRFPDVVNGSGHVCDLLYFSVCLSVRQSLLITNICCPPQKIPQQTNENDCGVFVLEVTNHWSTSNLPLCVLNASHASPLLLLSIPDASHWQSRCTFPRRTFQRSERGCTKSCATVSWVRMPNKGSWFLPPPSCCR